MKAIRLTLTGNQETVTLSDVVFGTEVNEQLLSQAVRVYQARNRQGTASTQTRSFVKRTKKKWFKQKGTGNARHGARTSNIFVGGGVSHGPVGNQNWSLDMPKKMRIKAMVSAFAAQDGNIFVTEDLNEVKNNKEARKMIVQLQGKSDSVLIILPKTIESTVRALRNMGDVILMSAMRVNALDIVQADKIVIADTALEILENRILGRTMIEVKPAVKASKPAVVKSTKPEAKAAKPEVKPAKTAVKKTTAKKPAVKKATKKETVEK